MAKTNLHMSKQQGAVALITTMIISILLIITTAGMVAVTVKSVRQTTDGAQSTKAYYAAEGALEEAILRINNGDTTSTCPTTNLITSTSSAATGAVTCTIVSQTSNQQTGTLAKDAVTQIDLSSVSGVAAVKIEWNVQDQKPVFSQIPNYYANGFPSNGGAVSWGTNAPGVVELNTIEFPTNATFSVADVYNYITLFGPESDKSTDASYAIPSSVEQFLVGYKETQNANTSDGANFPFVVTCVSAQASSYPCSVAVGNFTPSSKKYILRLKARYNGIKYKITVLDSANNPITIPTTTYTVDVTARAGDTFRRVQTSFTGIPKSVDGLDYVLYSDTDICKSFEIKAGVASTLNGICATP